MKLKILLIAGAFLILSGSAFAAGVNIHLNNDGQSGIGNGSNGQPLAAGNLVQMIKINRGGSITGRIGQAAEAAPPDPGQANWVDANAQQEFVGNFVVGAGANNQAGTFDVSFPAAVGDHFIRVWEAAALAAGARYQDIYTPASGEDVLFPLDVSVANFQTGINASAPPAPGINITIPSVVAFDLESGEFEQTMTAAAALSMAEGVRLASINGGRYHIEYIKESDWNDAQGWNANQVVAINGDGPNINLPNLLPGTAYRVRAFARNHFVGNNPVWTEVQNINTPQAPATGGFAPTNLAITLNNDGSVSLSWDLAGADAATVDRSTDRGRTWATIQQGGANLAIAAADSALENQDQNVASVLYRVRAAGGFLAEKIVGKHTFRFVGGGNVIGVNTFALPFAVTSPNIVTLLDFVNAVNTAAGENVVMVCGFWDNTNKKFEGAKKITYSDNAMDAASSAALADIDVQQGTNYQISVNNSVNLVVTGER